MPCVLPNHYTIIRLLTIAPQWRLAFTTMAEKAKAVFYFIIVFMKIQANSHLGTGLASGTISGLETDENGNITGFNPQKFALGFLGGSAGSIAFKKGKDFLDKNPKYKEAIKKELADTLAQGFENASKKYPMLDMLKPIKLNIMQGEKARVAQANHILNKLEKDEAKLATIKEKTIKAVDRYAQTQAFKALSKDKQEAILSLKDIVPSPMPNDTPKGDLSKILKHFSSKQDKTQREFYAKLIDDTKANADITLEVTKQNTPRKEYIKAYQHKEDRDLYYIVITEDKDKINVTAFPTTQVNKIVSDIAKSMKVSGGSLGDTTNRQADKSPSPKLAR